jgi:hypothetical protein
MTTRLIVEEVEGGLLQVALHREGQTLAKAAGAPAAFSAPLGEAEREDLRWYLEGYLAAPFAVYEERGQQIAAQLSRWGEALFGSAFGEGAPGRDAYVMSA